MGELAVPGPLVSVQWLAQNLGHGKLLVFDASMKPVGGAAQQKSSSPPQAIPGARRFDFDEKICDQGSSLPHMMPTPEQFQREVRALGLRADSVAVVYDSVGVYSSPRAWWMLRAMGHRQVAVLDGGLPAWIKEGHRTETLGDGPYDAGDFIARPQPGSFCDADEVARALEDAGTAVVDARSEGRFLGREPEPREGLRSGHMPGARNLPFSAVQKEGRMLPPAELRTLLRGKVADGQRLILSCGSGVTACVVALAAELAGHPRITVYDGSWSEWGLPTSSRAVE